MRSFIIKNKKSIFAISNIYISAVVGAGFATGQEIMTFFTRYGIKSFVGITISTMLF